MHCLCHCHSDTDSFTHTHTHILQPHGRRKVRRRWRTVTWYTRTNKRMKNITTTAAAAQPSAIISMVRCNVQHINFTVVTFNFQTLLVGCVCVRESVFLSFRWGFSCWLSLCFDGMWNDSLSLFRSTGVCHLLWLLLLRCSWDKKMIPRFTYEYYILRQMLSVVQITYVYYGKYAYEKSRKY